MGEESAPEKLTLSERLTVTKTVGAGAVRRAEVWTAAFRLLLNPDEAIVYSRCCGYGFYEGPLVQASPPLALPQAFCVQCAEPTDLLLLPEARWPWSSAQANLGLLLGLDPLTTIVETADLWAEVERLRSLL